MASYEEAVAQVTSDITNSGLTPATQQAILDIVAPPGSEQVKIENYNGDVASEGVQILRVDNSVQLTGDPGAPVIIMDADAQPADLTFAADSKIEALVLGGGDDRVVFQGDNNVVVETGGGNDSVVTGGGDDVITVKGGDATVNTGDGADVVNLQGEGNTTIIGGDGPMLINLQTGQGSATIDAGDGFDQLRVGEDRAAHSFTIDATGQVVMHSTNPITMQGLDVVGFDKNGDGQITSDDNISIIASNINDSLVGKLYKIALGREAIDGEDGWGGSTLGGINWWMQEFEKGQTDGTVEHLVRSFLNCDEFHDKYDDASNADYVNALFSNLGLTDPVKAADYLQQLNSGTMDRETVAWDLANSDEAVEILGIDGANYVIDVF